MEKTLTTRSRCAEHGTFLRCPRCSAVHKIHHMGFWGLVCVNCEATVPKCEWIMARQATARDLITYAEGEGEVAMILRSFLQERGYDGSPQEVASLRYFMIKHGLRPGDSSGWFYLYWTHDYFSLRDAVSQPQDKVEAQLAHARKHKELQAKIKALREAGRDWEITTLIREYWEQDKRDAEIRREQELRLADPASMDVQEVV